MNIDAGITIVVLLGLIFIVGTVCTIVSMIVDDDTKVHQEIVKPNKKKYDPPEFVFGNDYDGIILYDDNDTNSLT